MTVQDQTTRANAKRATMAKLPFFTDDRRNCRLINNQEKSNNQPTLPRRRAKATTGSSCRAFKLPYDFGGRRMRTLTRDDIEKRYRQFVSLTSFDVASA